jgi:ketosteroid isomerase-like protein
MVTKFSLLLLCCGFLAHGQPGSDEKAIGQTLDSWHRAAADAQFDAYFALTSPDFIFIGTDATEYWDRDAFQAYAKPHFDKGRAWSFKAVERHIYVKGEVAWFDELLDTKMKLCRGSGVLRKINGKWLIAHYVLSMTVPNDTANAVIKIKAPIEDAQLQSIRK